MIRPNNASRLMYFIFIARIGLFVLMKKATYLFSTVFFSLIFQEENREILLWLDSYGFYIYSIYILISYRIFSLFFRKKIVTVCCDFGYLWILCIFYIHIYLVQYFFLDFSGRESWHFLWLWIFLDSNSVNPGIPSLLFAEFCILYSDSHNIAMFRTETTDLCKIEETNFMMP